MNLFSILGLFIAQITTAETIATCSGAHRKALSACAAHEHAVNPNSLTIISSATRERIVREEEVKIAGLKTQCLRVQEACALACDEEVEIASLDGLDLTLPLERLNDCRQGEVAVHLKKMDRKLLDLRRVLNIKSEPRQPMKSAANR